MLVPGIGVKSVCGIFAMAIFNLYYDIELLADSLAEVAGRLLRGDLLLGSQNIAFITNYDFLFTLESWKDLQRVKILLRKSGQQKNGFAFLELRGVFVTVLALSDARRDNY